MASGRPPSASGKAAVGGSSHVKRAGKAPDSATPKAKATRKLKLAAKVIGATSKARTPKKLAPGR